MKIAIIGAGWNGIHTALKLAQKGHLITIYESNVEILRGLSGTFGVRIHIGPHYPQSEATRKACQSDYLRFVKEYQDIIVEHDKSYYALGVSDVLGNPSRVDDDTFDGVCKEFHFDETINLDKQSEFSRNNLSSLHSVHEPSALVGQPLRDKLLERLQKTNIKIKYSSKVTKVARKNNEFTIVINEAEDVKETFDYVVNSTGFQSLIPKEPLPFNMNVVSQICAVTLVEDQQPRSNKPFSFTVMDGRYPCIMPYLDGKANQYIIYHSLYTILATFSSYQESWNYLKENIDDDYLYENVIAPSLEDISRFIPDAKSRFKVISTKMGILQKVDTNREYRGPIVFQSPDGMIYSVSAKITNVCSAADDVLFLTDPMRQNEILSLASGYRYVPGGTLDNAKEEISEEKTDHNRTCAINRVNELKPKDQQQSWNRIGFFSASEVTEQWSPNQFSTSSPKPLIALKLKKALFTSEHDDSDTTPREDDCDSTPPENDYGSTPPDINEENNLCRKRLLGELSDGNRKPLKRSADASEIEAQAAAELLMPRFF